MFDKAAQIVTGNLFEIGSAVAGKIGDKTDDRLGGSTDCAGSAPASILVLQIAFYMGLTEKIPFFKPLKALFNQRISGPFG